MPGFIERKRELTVLPGSELTVSTICVHRGLAISRRHRNNEEEEEKPAAFGKNPRTEFFVDTVASCYVNSYKAGCSTEHCGEMEEVWRMLFKWWESVSRSTAFGA
jgi:hypothetical protein